PLCVAGRPWQVAYEEWKRLRDKSEYAAWLAAHGFCANHFTVLVNALQSIDSLQQLNSLLIERGFQLNGEKGAIQGSPHDYLEQSSTAAPTIDVQFSDGAYAVPGCYFEFARRYPLPNGKLFSGFVAKSADKIFESTDSRKT
ncbi:MAG: 2-oxoadipate dioxygenase/decarboxylase family protein, partial [Blastopirellula sp. JB062]